MLKDLIKLANHLDQKGLMAEADYLDKIIKSARLFGKNNVSNESAQNPAGGPAPTEGISADRRSFTAKYLFSVDPQLAMAQADMAAKNGLLEELKKELEAENPSMEIKNTPMEITKREQHGDYIYSTATLKK